MSSTEEKDLTREQKEFLEECMLEFGNRFTDEDSDFKEALERDISTPPIVNPWYGRPRIITNRSNYRQFHQNRNDKDNRDYHNNFRRDRYRNDGHNKRFKHS